MVRAGQVRRHCAQMPDNRERLFVVSALLARHVSTRMPQDLTEEGLDWERVASLAFRQAVLPSLVEAMRWSKLEEQVQRPVWERMEEIHGNNAMRNLVLMKDLAGLFRLLEPAGIDSLVFKGGALLSTVFAEGRQRHLDDIDLLIREAEAERAHQLLRERGYEPRTISTLRPDGRTSVLGYRQFRGLHHLQPLASPRGTLVDLHHRNPWGMDVEELFLRSSRVQTQFGPVVIPSPADQLVLLCSHVFVHHRTTLRLRHLVDLLYLTDEAYISSAELHRLRRSCPAVEASMRLLASLIAAVAEDDVRASTRLLRQVTPLPNRFRVFAGSLVLEWRKGPRQAFYHAFPSRRYLGQMYGVPPEEVRPLLCHLDRILGGRLLRRPWRD